MTSSGLGFGFAFFRGAAAGAMTGAAPAADAAAGAAAGAANGAAAGGEGQGPLRLPADENRLIVKKYNSTPATQAELRDCSAELSQDNLKLVVGSHKVSVWWGQLKL